MNTKEKALKTTRPCALLPAADFPSPSLPSSSHFRPNSLQICYITLFRAVLTISDALTQTLREERLAPKASLATFCLLGPRTSVRCRIRSFRFKPFRSDRLMRFPCLPWHKAAAVAIRRLFIRYKPECSILCSATLRCLYNVNTLLMLSILYIQAIVNVAQRGKEENCRDKMGPADFLV